MNNKGQIEGIPQNPRTITKHKFKLLCDSITKKDFNELRPLDVVAFENKYVVLSGNMRLRAYKKLKHKSVICNILSESLSIEELIQIMVQGNTTYGEDDHEVYANEYDSDLLHEWGYDVPDWEEDQVTYEETQGDDDVPESVPAITVKGDLYELGDHRLLCGDSTVVTDIDKLMDGEKAVLGHNDPPYGMKKEKDGIKNDNLNYDDLLAFNNEWITLQFTYLKDNGSFYCWGIDEPLMDLYSKIIKPLIKTQKATFRNLITWNKRGGHGQSSEEFRSYPKADEKCLFVMCGVQGFDNNEDNYFEGWETIRDYLLQSRLAMGWDVPTMKRIVGHSCLYRDHWTSKSQFNLPTREVYNKMKAEADRLRRETNNDAFIKEYDEIKKEYDSTRAYFDNTHDNMTNVWDIGRTSGAERDQTGGHATPKPLELCERVIKSSSPKGALVTDWFLGSGSTLIACEKTNRKCYGMELDEKYCDVIVKRYIEFCIKNNKESKVYRNGELIKNEELKS